MITLGDIVDNITIQGDVRISTWDHDGENETVLFQKNVGDYFCLPRFLRKYENREVLYMFCPGDGYLHIEIESEEE